MTDWSCWRKRSSGFLEVDGGLQPGSRGGGGGGGGGRMHAASLDMSPERVRPLEASDGDPAR